MLPRLSTAGRRMAAASSIRVSRCFPHPPAASRLDCRRARRQHVVRGREYPVPGSDRQCHRAHHARRRHHRVSVARSEGALWNRRRSRRGGLVRRFLWAKGRSHDGCDIMWRDIPFDRHDPTTWGKPFIRLPFYRGGPFEKAANTPLLHGAFDQLVGKGRWVPSDRPHPGTIG